MATPIRESFLIPDPDNEDKFIINSTGRGVIDAINGIPLFLSPLADTGCRFKTPSGAICAKPVRWIKEPLHSFDSVNTIGCDSRGHWENSWDELYGETVFQKINEEDEEETVGREKGIVDTASRLAKQEAEKLGVEFKEGQSVKARPDGAAPDGKTWSYLLGEWKEENWLVKRKAMNSGDDEMRVKKKVVGDEVRVEKDVVDLAGEEVRVKMKADDHGDPAK
jgi:hypothetical protein